jgi:hypothetical protein
MKRAFFLTCLLPLLTAHAHDHVEVGRSATHPYQLALSGPGYQLALFVPVGELFSGYLPAFPGGCFADELTFTTEVNVLDAANGADPEVELVSIIGPTGGAISFWEAGTILPSWTRPSGWNQTETDRPSFPVILGGDGHIHGRAFSVDRPGEYHVIFRARDKQNVFSPSRDFSMTFQAQHPPPLSIRTENGSVRLTFISRLNLVYDLQICTDLALNRWSNVQPHVSIDGSGALVDLSVPLAHPRAFFRLIEYK